MPGDICGGVVEEDNFPGQFKKLEDKIEALVQTCRDLQQNRSELESKIHELEEFIKAKVVAEQEYAQEKSMIRGKVDDLLSRLDHVLESK